MEISTNGRSGNGKVSSAPSTQDLESALKRVEGVQAARVVFGPEFKVEEVHVLTSGDRSAKRIVRDVQSTILAGFSLDIDYRAVSVARLGDESPAANLTSSASAVEAPRSASRATVESVAATSRGKSLEVALELKYGEQTYQGVGRGTAGGAFKVAASATLDALTELLGDRVAEVEYADIVPTAGQSVALVVVKISVRDAEHRLSGCAMVRSEPSDAIVRATFAAINRILPSAPLASSGQPS